MTRIFQFCFYDVLWHFQTCHKMFRTRFYHLWFRQHIKNVLAMSFKMSNNDVSKIPWECSWVARNVLMRFLWHFNNNFESTAFGQHCVNVAWMLLPNIEILPNYNVMQHCLNVVQTLVPTTEIYKTAAFTLRCVSDVPNMVLALYSITFLSERRLHKTLN